MERERAWERVQLALDERRDPFEDELLHEWFAEHPRELEEYARLERRLTELTQHASDQTVPQMRSGGPRRRLMELAVTAAATVVAIFAAQRARLDDATNRAEAPDALTQSRVIDYRITATRHNGRRTFRASRSLNGALQITNTSNLPPMNTDFARPTSETFDPETNR
jgi:hypothetical protein